MIKAIIALKHLEILNMFKSVSSISKKDVREQKALTDLQILQFALAEFASAIEMLHAAKLANNHKLAIGFLNHALDEYKHTNFFLKVISKSGESSVKFDPRQTVSNGFIKTDHFLYEKLSLIKFSAFIAVNEANALNIFTSLREKFNRYDNKYLEELDSIIADELEHFHTATQSENEKANRDQLQLYDELLTDEARHVAFASGFLEKNATNRAAFIMRAKSKIATKLRHFFASQERLRKIVDTSISTLAIILLIPLRSTLKLPPLTDNDFFSDSAARSML